MEREVSYLQKKTAAQSVSVNWSKTGFNYLAIGNSITKHSICDYWWNEIGMAASTEDKDYYHIVTDYLRQTYDDVYSYAYNGSSWETQTNDRTETLEMWDAYLSSDIDLVTIQLSENVTYMTTLSDDFSEMIEYVHNKCPGAQMIVIDDFWSDEKSVIKKKAVDELNEKGLKVEFVNLSEIRGVSKYMVGMGTTVYDADGGEHIIDHSGVAKHPGDLGMKYYAEEIIRKIK